MGRQEFNGYVALVVFSIFVTISNFMIGHEYTSVKVRRAQLQPTISTRRRLLHVEDASLNFHQLLLNSRYARYYNATSGKSILTETDSVYRMSNMSPFVLEEHHLVFFTVPKVACTVFKQLFRRMKGYKNWRKQNNDLPHKQTHNGLKLLKDYPLDVANDMLTNTSWTRAIFFRDPRERLLSAYLDKGRKVNLMNRWCCRETQDCGKKSAASFDAFLSIVPECLNDHWTAQARRFEEKFWFQINFVGYMENGAADTKRLLDRIDGKESSASDKSLWNRFGADGWGVNADEHIFEGSTIRHGTSSSGKITDYYNTTEILKKAENILRVDYEHPLIASSIKNIY